MVNIILTAAGRGSRFSQAGYPDMKPFIPVNGKRMIERVLENVVGTKHKSEYKFALLFLKEFIDNNSKELTKICDKYCYEYDIVSVDKITEGAVCTALLAESFIDLDKELVLTDCDHLADLDHIYNGIEYFRSKKADGGFWNFISDDPKYSYIRINNGLVREVVEKQVISNLANTGSYYFAKASDFIKYAKEMIKADDRVRNEFYVSQVYKYMLVDNKKILPYLVNRFAGLGTPSDLQEYLKECK